MNSRVRKRYPFDIRCAIVFIVLGYCFINLSLLQPVLRQTLAFSCFGVSIIFSIREITEDLFKRGMIKGYLLAVAIMFCCYLVYETLGAYGEYGHNKYLYLLFVVFLGFFAFPPVLKYGFSRLIFTRLLFYISLLFCFFAIFFANPDEGRRSEMGLNPAILARLCMIAGIYISTIIYFKGLSVVRALILLFSITAVFFTATKTPVPVYVFSFYFVTLQKISFRKFLKVFFYIFIIGITGFLILKYAVPERYTKRILDPKGLSIEKQSVEGNRIDLYNKVFEILPDHLEGIGYGGFGEYSFIVVPHNVFLEMAVESGVVFAILFLIWSICVIIKIKRSKVDNIPNTFISILYVYFFISFLFGGELTIQALLFYILGTYILFYSSIRRVPKLDSLIKTK